MEETLAVGTLVLLTTGYVGVSVGTYEVERIEDGAADGVTTTVAGVVGTAAVEASTLVGVVGTTGVEASTLAGVVGAAS